MHNRGFKRAVKHVTGEQLPYGKKQLISLSLVDYVYTGGAWTIINQIKFKADTCKLSQREAEKQSQ